MSEKNMNTNNSENLDPLKILSGQKKIASVLGISTRTLQRHLKSIPISKFGNTTIIPESVLIEWIKENSHILWKRKKS